MDKASGRRFKQFETPPLAFSFDRVLQTYRDSACGPHALNPAA
jgi:hypothetical protein